MAEKNFPYHYKETRALRAVQHSNYNYTKRRII